MSNEQESINLNTVNLQTAITDTQAWQINQPVKAFLFHKNELECVESVSGAAKIRFYMGLETSTAGDKLHGLAVAVNNLHQDIIDPAGSNSLIYNFALPCPSTCDTNSVLYHGPASTSTPNYVPTQHTNCIQRLQEVPYQSAVDWTLNWQSNHQYYSFLYSIDELQTAMGNESRIRVYFALDVIHDKIYSVMVGVNDNGIDIVPANLPVNDLTVCGSQGNLPNICDLTSPLSHTI